MSNTLTAEARDGPDALPNFRQELYEGFESITNKGFAKWTTQVERHNVRRFLFTNASEIRQLVLNCPALGELRGDDTIMRLTKNRRKKANIHQWVHSRNRPPRYVIVIHGWLLRDYTMGYTESAWSFSDVHACSDVAKQVEDMYASWLEKLRGTTTQFSSCRISDEHSEHGPRCTTDDECAGYDEIPCVQAERIESMRIPLHKYEGGHKNETIEFRRFVYFNRSTIADLIQGYRRIQPGEEHYGIHGRISREDRRRLCISRGAKFSTSAQNYSVYFLNITFSGHMLDIHPRLAMFDNPVDCSRVAAQILDMYRNWKYTTRDTEIYARSVACD